MTDIETEGDKHSGTRINDTPFPCSDREAIEVHVDARNSKGSFHVSAVCPLPQDVQRRSPFVFGQGGNGGYTLIREREHLIPDRRTAVASTKGRWRFQHTRRRDSTDLSSPPATRAGRLNCDLDSIDVERGGE